MFEPAPLEIVLAGEVGVESRPAHIGGLTNILHGDRVVAFFYDQGEQRLMQHFPATGHATIYWSFGHFSLCSRPDREICPIRDIPIGTVRENFFGLRVSYRTVRPVLQRRGRLALRPQ